MKLVAVDSPIVVEGLVVPIIEVLSLLPSVVGETLFVIPGLALSLLILIVVLLTCVVVVLFIDVALIRLDLSVVCTVVV